MSGEEEGQEEDFYDLYWIYFYGIYKDVADLREELMERMKPVKDFPSVVCLNLADRLGSYVQWKAERDKRTHMQLWVKYVGKVVEIERLVALQLIEELIKDYEENEEDAMRAGKAFYQNLSSGW